MQDVKLTGFDRIPESPAGQIQPVDLVILCLSQADLMDGNVHQLETVSWYYPGVKIIVFENVRNVQAFRNLIAYLKMGIRGYITALDSLEVIEYAIRKVLAGNRYIGEDALEWLLDRFAIDNVSNGLTVNELDVARLLMEGRSVTQIARETNRKTSTISTIKRSILKKTKANNIIKLFEVLNPGSNPGLALFREPPLRKKRTHRLPV